MMSLSTLSSMARPGVRVSGASRAVLLLLEVEQSGVVAPIGVAEELLQALVGVAAVEERAQLLECLQVARLADAQEHDAVDDLLHRIVDVAAAQRWVAQHQVARQQLAPALDLGQELVVHLRGATLARLGLRELVQRALPHRGLAEHPGDLVPACGTYSL